MTFVQATFVHTRNIPEEKKQERICQGWINGNSLYWQEHKKTKIVNNGKNITKHLISMMDQQKS